MKCGQALSGAAAPADPRFASPHGFKGRGHGLTSTAPAELARVVRNFLRTGQP